MMDELSAVEDELRDIATRLDRLTQRLPAMELDDEQRKSVQRLMFSVQTSADDLATATFAAWEGR
jgi:hypothetical protein